MRYGERRLHPWSTSMRGLACRVALVLVTATLAGCSTLVTALASASTAPDPLAGLRIVSPQLVAETTPAELLARLERADVVCIGEQHDDPETHRVEAALLDAIGQSGRPVIVSLEMFERDVQPVVDEYLAGRVTEQEFLARSRPWDRYATDYRRLVELAKQRGWPVIAANVPRPLASAVGRRGMAALDSLTPNARRVAALETSCPRDDYHARFMESMQSHAPSGGAAPQAGDSLPTAMAERFYLAQCVKDETMAESIVAARLAAPRNAIAVHFDGAFHSDYAQGTVARVKRRQPSWTLVVLSAVPVADPAVAPIVTQGGKADYVIFTRRSQGNQ